MSSESADRTVLYPLIDDNVSKNKSLHTCLERVSKYS